MKWSEIAYYFTSWKKSLNFKIGNESSYIKQPLDPADDERAIFLFGLSSFYDNLERSPVLFVLSPSNKLFISFIKVTRSWHGVLINKHSWHSFNSVTPASSPASFSMSLFKDASPICQSNTGKISVTHGSLIDNENVHRAPQVKKKKSIDFKSM